MDSKPETCVLMYTDIPTSGNLIADSVNFMSCDTMYHVCGTLPVDFFFGPPKDDVSVRDVRCEITENRKQS